MYSAAQPAGIPCSFCCFCFCFCCASDDDEDDEDDEKGEDEGGGKSKEEDGIVGPPASTACTAPTTMDRTSSADGSLLLLLVVAWCRCSAAYASAPAERAAKTAGAARRSAGERYALRLLRASPSAARAVGTTTICHSG